MWIVSAWQTLVIGIGIIVNDRKMRALIKRMDEINREWGAKMNQKDH
jgi:hypothetical protein